MFRILGVNGLVACYQLSALSLFGVKMGDGQATVVGMSVAALFLLLSLVTPVEGLTAARPPARVFHPRLLLSVAGQALVHLAVLVLATHVWADELAPATVDGDFAPNLLNSVVFLLSWTMQTTTFAVNYQGPPFMRPLPQVPGLHRALLLSYLAALVTAAGVLPEVGEWLQLVPMEANVRQMVLACMVADAVACFGWERLLRAALPA
jgi:cation-transporting ATPase 13A1